MIYLKKGTIVVCPACRNHLYEITRDLQVGELPTFDMFRGINGNADPRAYYTMKSPCCDHRYFVNGKLCTTIGWTN
jgi:hypothetical protein